MALNRLFSQLEKLYSKLGWNNAEAIKTKMSLMPDYMVIGTLTQFSLNAPTLNVIYSDIPEDYKFTIERVDTGIYRIYSPLIGPNNTIVETNKFYYDPPTDITTVTFVSVYDGYIELKTTDAYTITDPVDTEFKHLPIKIKCWLNTDISATLVPPPPPEVYIYRATVGYDRLAYSSDLHLDANVTIIDMDTNTVIGNTTPGMWESAIFEMQYNYPVWGFARTDGTNGKFAFELYYETDILPNWKIIIDDGTTLVEEPLTFTVFAMNWGFFNSYNNYSFTNSNPGDYYLFRASMNGLEEVYPSTDIAPLLNDINPGSGQTFFDFLTVVNGRQSKIFMSALNSQANETTINNGISICNLYTVKHLNTLQRDLVAAPNTFPQFFTGFYNYPANNTGCDSCFKFYYATVPPGILDTTFIYSVDPFYSYTTDEGAAFTDLADNLGGVGSFINYPGGFAGFSFFFKDKIENLPTIIINDYLTIIPTMYNEFYDSLGNALCTTIGCKQFIIPAYDAQMDLFVEGFYTFDMASYVGGPVDLNDTSTASSLLTGIIQSIYGTSLYSPAPEVVVDYSLDFSNIEVTIKNVPSFAQQSFIQTSGYFSDYYSTEITCP